MNKRLLHLLFLILATSALNGVDAAEEAFSEHQTIVFGANNDQTTYVGKLAILVYNEAFKRLKMNYQIKIFPLKPK